MTHVYIIRHAEAEGNVFRRCHGHYNSYITSRGMRQIDALAERFKDIHIDALYSSDLRRTVTTSGAITKYHGLEIIKDRNLREQYLGSWEDMPFGDLDYLYPEQMYCFNHDPENWTVAKGESFGNLQKRIVSEILKLANENDGKTIACVTHGMAIRAFIAYVLQLKPTDIGQIPYGDNTCVGSFFIEGDKITAEYYNDNSHLEASGDSTFARQSWWKDKGRKDRCNLRLVPLNPAENPEIYEHFYREAWRSVHNTEEGFYLIDYLPAARRHYEKEPRSLMIAKYGEETVGLIELDCISGCHDNMGRISLICVEPEYRGKQFAVQLLGHAVSLFRAMGYDRIGLTCFEGNERALAFYGEYGFKEVSRSRGHFGYLLNMERSI